MRVLIVEDNELLRDSLLQGLREAGFSVDGAADGTDGLWLAETGDYDAIVVDLMLPGIDGLTLLSLLRAKQNDTHVLILTAKDTVEDRIKGLNLGADDYLAKPFSFQELLARVQALVRRRYRQKSPAIVLGDIEVNTTRKMVEARNELVRPRYSCRAENQPPIPYAETKPRITPASTFQVLQGVSDRVANDSVAPSPPPHKSPCSSE